HTHRHTDTQTQTHRHTDTQTHRETETQRHRDTQTHTDTHTHTHTHTDTQRDRDTETQRHTDTHRHTHTHTHTHRVVYLMTVGMISAVKRMQRGGGAWGENRPITENTVFMQADTITIRCIAAVRVLQQ